MASGHGGENQEESVRIAHLTMLQGVIGRMGSNCFALKALSATLAAAAAAVISIARDAHLVTLGFFSLPIVMFWLMDAQYLRYEAAYRSLYEKVRSGDNVEAYSLSVNPFMQDAEHVLKSALSWSILPYYFSILLMLIVTSITLSRGEAILAEAPTNLLDCSSVALNLFGEKFAFSACSGDSI